MRSALLLPALLLLTPPLLAQDQVPLSKPAARAPAESAIPAARDIAFPGTMQLEVDATDVARAIFSVKQTMPIPPDAARKGQFTLLFPEWLPGNHAPRGEIEKLVGISFAADGETLRWRRDSLDVYAFHIDVPRGAETITARFQFVSPTDSNQGRVVVAPKMMNLRWHNMALYPAGYFTRNIPVEASVTWPRGWQAATALRPAETDGDTVRYQRTDFDTLVDSPVFAGAHFKRWELAEGIALNVVADAPEFLEASDEQIEKHRRLVREALHLFGSRQFDHYDFLLALSEEMGGIGIEHHRSSENGTGSDYFTGWDKGPGSRDLLPHEMTHSWNGKYRRPAGIWAPDFKTPSRDDLLWVYEGQTQLWGYVLAARSGLYSKQQALDAFASIAAGLDQRVGRQWRPLADTTHDPIIAARRPKPWNTWQRSEDYYNEGLLIWLEADQIIRRESGGERSLEDFARSFLAGREGDWGVVTYDLADVVAALQAVQPYDWRSFLDERVFSVTSEAPKRGLELGGYRLIYTTEPTDYLRAGEADQNGAWLSWSIGLNTDSKGHVSYVVWGSPGFDAGITDGDTITAVNEEDFTAARLKQAVAESGDKPVKLLVKKGKRYRETTLSYSGGLRYPRLEKIGAGSGEGEAGLDRLLAPQTGQATD